ncbi:HAD hydrolase-like protein [Bradyrhizobium genosp. L]|uniref:HAD hydrolase-like protein n=1 Tax=Bradyrhizobium genosp. L TaxID=83637 RepID=UPI0018A31BC2|nr:HAD hydrolase-like protein [Bradyrhizobium genosp. L]QPF85400.1 HAD hydrolase-like protein [Bradyrhizobium genosp. L]
MIHFAQFKVITFDCYGTLIDWDSSISQLVQPWLSAMGSPVPPDLVVSTFALMQARHQQTRPTLLYPEVLRRSWRDIEEQFGWEANPERADAFAQSVPHWRPFADTVDSLRYLSRHYRLAILSNVDNASLQGTLKLLEVPFLFTVTAEDVSSYKPGQPHFDAAFREVARHGMVGSDILHVAQSKHHDIAPGNSLGLTTVWVNRRHGKKGTGATLAATAEPTLTINSLAELVDLHRAAQAGSAPLASAR